jgi:L-iditol 2-dehydrogenase
MKSCIIGSDRNVEVAEVDVPHLNAGDILVEMKACGICGTDLEKVKGNYASRILGHEAVGIVAGVGAGVESFEIGERVFPHHHVPCYTCHYCRSGSETMCPDFSRSNLDPGGLAEYFRVPEWNVSRGGVFRLPKSVNFRTGAMIEPFACVVRGLGKTRLNEENTAAVVGVGPVGMMHILGLKFDSRCSVAAIDVSPQRLDFAADIGADFTFPSRESVEGIASVTDGIGADVVFIATGNREAIETAIRLARKGGRIIQFGLPSPGMVLPADYSELFRKEISIISTYSAVEKDVERAISIISGGPEKFEALISHSFRLEDAPAAFEAAERTDTARKVIVER